MELSQITYEGNTYTIGYIGNRLCIEKQTVGENTFVRNWYKVVDDSEFTYKIMKTQIKAIGGAYGLYKFFKRNIDDNFAIECWVIEPLNKILTTVKPYRW